MAPWTARATPALLFGLRPYGPATLVTACAVLACVGMVANYPPAGSASCLNPMQATMRMARRIRRTIWRNFAGTLAVDALGIVLAAFGMLGPLLAAFIHVTSELTFILNSARLLPRSRPQTASKVLLEVRS